MKPIEFASDNGVLQFANENNLFTIGPIYFLSSLDFSIVSGFTLYNSNGIKHGNFIRAENGLYLFSSASEETEIIDINFNKGTKGQILVTFLSKLNFKAVEHLFNFIIQLNSNQLFKIEDINGYKILLLNNNPIVAFQNLGNDIYRYTIVDFDFVEQ